MAMLGFVNHSKLPLRLASFIGFSVSLLSLLLAVVYLIYKLVDWDHFQLGLAPLVIGIFFFGGIQLFFLGIIGEYIGAIFTQVKKRPLVIEKERINFDV
jgi:glycosyltransferase involved in cell wall biosynthesis